MTVNGAFALFGAITVTSAVATWIGGMLVGTHVLGLGRGAPAGRLRAPGPRRWPGGCSRSG